MEISIELVKDLRQRTGAGIVDCKAALQEAGGSIEAAIDYLRKKGLATAAKKAGRIATDGLVASYIHAGGKMGVLVEINCETDFVAKTGDFQEFVKNMAMHIAAANPQFIRREDVPSDVLEKEREIYRTQALDSGKPEKVIDKIVEGKLERFYSETCLLEQTYIRDSDVTVKEVLDGMIGKLGENIAIRRFARFQLGEGLSSRS
ncbi:MAG: translation elongation factor Ts [Deltaproteobacteria bacterium]|nr:translation elongation factor Ts [Deltaproteobacteria bacterium]MDO9351106.1 translation elongation factor Ts [Deltaproteobacteria bacterium]MDP3016253.1 translation elongation factor Ts [Deltaproteobacteria bacterium]